MPRSRFVKKRPILPDTRYNSTVITRFVARMMLQGKRLINLHIFYQALDIVKEKAGKEPLEVFIKALDNVRPLIEVKSRRVGGSTFQVPIEIKEERGEALAMRWLIHFARARSGKSMGDRLGAEIMDAFNSTGNAFKKKEDTHRMAEANKAFAHYRW